MDTTSRRQEHTEATRRALLDAALGLFGADGYAATSLEDITRAARVTKGALYHHFAGKQQLFEVVVAEVEAGEVARVATAAGAAGSSWDAALAGMDAAFDGYLDPVYRQIVLLDAPTVLGFARWSELAQANSLGLVRTVLDALVADGTLRPQPTDLLARVVLAAETQAALSVAAAADPPAARRQAQGLLRDLLSGLRTDAPTRRSS